MVGCVLGVGVDEAIRDCDNVDGLGGGIARVYYNQKPRRLRGVRVRSVITTRAWRVPVCDTFESAFAACLSEPLTQLFNNLILRRTVHQYRARNSVMHGHAHRRSVWRILRGERD